MSGYTGRIMTPMEVLAKFRDSEISLHKGKENQQSGSLLSKQACQTNSSPNVELERKLEKLTACVTNALSEDFRIPSQRDKLRKRKGCQLFSHVSQSGREEAAEKRIKIEEKRPVSTKANITFTLMGASNIGGRPYNEDRYRSRTVIYKREKYIMAGIFDGHGGAQAAKYVSNHLFNKIMLNIQCGIESIPEAIRAAFVGVHEDMLKYELANWPQIRGYLPSTAGTTASIVVIKGRTCYYANVGDSPIILAVKNEKLNGWESVRLSVDHSVDNADELAGILNRGGQVIEDRVVWNRPRIGGGVAPVRFLNMTRSLGDFWSQHQETGEFVVSPIPQIGVIDLNPSVKCILLCSDGLSNIASDDKIVRMLEEINNKETCAKSHFGVANCFVNTPCELIKKAAEGLDLLILDNITAVTMKVKFVNADTGEEI